MSKSISGLFPNTHNNDIIIKTLTYTAIDNMIKNTPGGRGKSMACGAYDPITNQIATAFAGKIPQKIHPELRRRANLIGGIGTHGLTKKNYIGVCAEFQVVNELLNKGCDISNIKLTKAIRPRTGKVQPYCKNCKTMFSDLID